MANLNWGTKTKYLGEQGNINHFRDQKAENKFTSSFREKMEHKQIFTVEACNA